MIMYNELQKMRYIGNTPALYKVRPCTFKSTLNPRGRPKKGT